jgi:hypothetical protein
VLLGEQRFGTDATAGRSGERNRDGDEANDAGASTPATGLLPLPSGLRPSLEMAWWIERAATTTAVTAMLHLSARPRFGDLDGDMTSSSR